MYYKQHTAQQIKLGNFVPGPLQVEDSVAFTDALIKLFANEDMSAVKAALPTLKHKEDRLDALKPLVNELFTVVKFSSRSGLACIVEPMSGEGFAVPATVLVLVSLLDITSPR